MSRLVVLAGLPGVGKTTLARALAGRSGAFWLRIDSIEDALATSAHAIADAKDAGYRIAMAVARDNLALGRDTVADAVNAWDEGRALWAALATETGAELIAVELVCATPVHRARVEARHAADPATPDWAMASGRAYAPWPCALRLDVSDGIEDALTILAARLTPSS